MESSASASASAAAAAAEISRGSLETFVYKIERLAKPLLRAFGRHSEPPSIYDADLDLLRRMLARIRATLRDSRSLVIGDKLQQLWLAELREVERRAEDIIEDLEFHAIAKQRLADFKSQMAASSGSKRKREEQEVGLLLASPPIESLRRKIEALRNLHREIASDRKALCLRDEDGERRRPHCSVLPPTTSLMHEVFHGRVDDVKEVISWLVTDERCPPGDTSVISIDGPGGVGKTDTSIISIDGPGGVGKTCLARRVFGDSIVVSHFFPRVWICVSDGLDAAEVMKAIHEYLIMETPSPSNLDHLQQDVMRKLLGKRFLLVLDDLWSHDLWEIHWRRIQEVLQVGTVGSKIIVTSRNSRLAGSMGIVRSHHLSYLPNDDCFSIFKQHAFGYQDSSAYPSLIEIGKEITQKCKGLPLAAKVLGCFVRTALDEEHWRRVFEGLWSYVLHDDETWVGLWLSYDRFPEHLKCCFRYCSLFPKGYTFSKNQLAILWTAQGFSKSDESLKLTEVGRRNFDELVDMSLFQHLPSYSINNEKYIMHDLFHELAEIVCGTECIRMEDGVQREVQMKTLHSSLILEDFDPNMVIPFEVADGLDLRSLLLIRRYEHEKTVLNVKIPDFQLLQCLRALDLSHTDLENLPASIGYLIHLRYLALRNTKIQRLPESICGLFKLQSLDLEQCHHLQELPQGIKLLSDLQNLETPAHLKPCTPLGIEKLANPQSKLVVIESDEPQSFKIRKLADTLKSIFQ